MKIFIDIGHPAHVHYFKNFTKIMKIKGHKFFFSARNKEVVFDLLSKNNLKYYNRGDGSNTFLGKLLYLINADIKLYYIARKFKPDLFLSFSSPYAAHAAKLLGVPHIVFTDTEHAKIGNLAVVPFSDIICTPLSFKKDFGKKHIRFNGFMELCHLDPNYFTPDTSVLALLGVEKSKKYIILRFVSWDASHDVGHSGLTLKMKRNAVKELSKYTKVFISSEGELPEDLKPYQIRIPPEKIHDALAFSTLFVGEGATMASECAMLGTPAIYVNPLSAGTLEEQEKYGLIYGFRNSIGVLEKAMELINTPNLQKEFQRRRQKMLADKIDVTAFMVWFIENYPESAKIMRENPDYQFRFR